MNMKKIILALAAAALATSALAQEVIKLPQPDKNVSMTLYQALQQRASSVNILTHRSVTRLCPGCYGPHAE